MSLSETIARSRARTEVTRSLASLPAEARLEVVTEVLDEMGLLARFAAELAPLYVQAESTPPQAATDENAEKTDTPHPAPRRGSASAPRSILVARTGRPVKVGGYKDTLLRALRLSPRLPIADLAVNVYGENSKRNRDRVRSLLSVMNGRQVRRVAEGVWEALKENATEEAPR